MTKDQVTVSLSLRDSTGAVYDHQSCEGTTEDDGKTVTLPAGCLPGLEVAIAGDIQVCVISTDRVVAGITADAGGDQVVVFA